MNMLTVEKKNKEKEAGKGIFKNDFFTFCRKIPNLRLS